MPKVDFLGRPEGSKISIRNEFQLLSFPNLDNSSFLTTDIDGNILLQPNTLIGSTGLRDTLILTTLTNPSDAIYFIPINTLAEKLIVICADDFTLNVGTTLGGNDILDSLDVTGGQAGVISIDVYALIDTTLYFSAVPSDTTIIVIKNPG